MNQEPYIIEERIIKIRKFNPNYGMDRICECGHPYHRHFDGYEPEDCQDVGCKYCGCNDFKEVSPETCFGVIDPNYKILVKCNTYDDASTALWEMRSERPEPDAKVLDICKCEWNDTHGVPFEYGYDPAG